MDRKGIGGFMEAMVAMMAVVVTLMTFLTVLAYADTGVDDDDIDVSFLEEAYISQGTICGLNECSLFLLMEREGAEGVDLRLDMIGDVLGESLEMHCGERTDNPVGRTGALSLDSDDGRTLLARYEVICWS